MASKVDPRVGQRAELHPGTDAWMRGDRYGDIMSVSARTRSFIDPRDPRNGHTFRIKMDRSGRVLRVSEGNIYQIFPQSPGSN
jgi:hypothetical protein